MIDSLFSLDEMGVRGPFQMQCHHGEWEPMESGAGGHVWRPRKTEREAIKKCAEWTGLLFIPAMRVVDLTTGVVVWCDSFEKYVAEDGVEVVRWSGQEALYDEIRAEFRADRDRERVAVRKFEVPG